MNKFIITATMLIFLAACSNDNKETKSDLNNNEETVQVEETTENTDSLIENNDNEAKNNEENIEEEKTIDISVFEFAKNIDVTDARDITNHITLKLQMSDEAKPGMATNNVLQQAYDFLQQSDIEGAETVTLLIIIQEQKVAQFTITPSLIDFNDEDTPITNLVVAASKIDHMTDEVKEFGQTMGTW